MAAPIYILTRIGVWPATDEWWAARLDAFNYTRMSVLGQTYTNWKWLILTAPEHAEALKYSAARFNPDIEVIAAKHDEPHCLAQGNPGVPELPWPLIMAVSDRVGYGAHTVRLDMDDIWHPEYLAKVVEHQVEGYGLTFPEGYMIDRGRVAPRLYPDNHFLSYLAPAINRNHALSWPHDRFPQKHSIPVPGMWYQRTGLHNMNSNKWVKEVFAADNGGQPLEAEGWAGRWPWSWYPE